MSMIKPTNCPTDKPTYRRMLAKVLSGIIRSITSPATMASNAIPIRVKAIRFFIFGIIDGLANNNVHYNLRVSWYLVRFFISYEGKQNTAKFSETPYLTGTLNI